jgi:hypothetical protein
MFCRMRIKSLYVFRSSKYAFSGNPGQRGEETKGAGLKIEDGWLWCDGNGFQRLAGRRSRFEEKQGEENATYTRLVST